MALLEVKFYSEVLGMQTSMNVLLPQRTVGNIGVATGEVADSYPVLYLLHGMSDDHTIWSRRTKIELNTDWRGMAIVMPTTYLGWYTDMKHGPKYRKFIGEELPKICRRLFPGISAKREDTYIAGNSMGGYGAMAIALTYPETFSAAGLLSGAVDPRFLYDMWGSHGYYRDIFGRPEEFDGSENDLFHLAELRVNEGGKLPKLYMWCGSEDFLVEYNHKMHDHLTAIGYPHVYSECPGDHSWGHWDREIENILCYIFEQKWGGQL